MRFAVLGPGGVGGLLAALLSRGGDHVVVLHDSAPREIHVESKRFGDFTAEVAVAPRLSEPVDAVLVTVKATQLGEAMSRVPAPALGDGVAIPFLNGLEHVEVLRTTYGHDRVVPATIAIESTRVRPGVIRHTSPFAVIQMMGANSVAAHLRAAGLDVRMRDDELAMLWDKFSALAPMAMLTTRERAPVGVVRAQHREELSAVIDEYASVAAAEGVSIDRANVLRLIDSMQPAMESSMQRDQAAGRPLEIDALGGALLRRAAKAGIEVPVTKRLVEELEARPVSKSA